MSTPYPDTRTYLADYFSLLAARLHREVLRARLLRGPSTDETFLGLFLSDDEMERVLQGLHGAQIMYDDQAMSLEARAAELAAHISDRLAATTLPLRPARLAELFDLSPAALEVTLLLLAPEVDARFARVYAYLQDDVSRRWLSPGLALRLLPGTAVDDPAGRGLFAPDSPLVQHQLIRIGAGGEQVPAPLIDRPLKLDDRIVEYLLEHDSLDPALEEWAELNIPAAELTGLEASAGTPAQALARLPVDAGVAAQLAHLADLWRAPAAPGAFFWGREGSGKGAAAAALAHSLGRPLLTVDATLLAHPPVPELDSRLRRAGREAHLRGALLHIRHGDALDADGRAAALRLLGPGVILSTQAAWPLHALPQPPLVIHFPVPDFELRRRLWGSALAGRTNGNGRLPAELAGRFRLTPEQIARAAAVAQGQAWLRAGPDAVPVETDWFDGCRQQSNPNLAALAVKMSSPHTWDDLVLPEPQMALLRAIESQVRHVHTVYERWGFERKLAAGRGLNALFTGPSGTGKTMAAAILARSLGLDMYKIDLSAVVSKYIGETEKNLSHIFEEAGSANAILFFDEADALFGKRSEVKDAHDRYANIEISYLLQKMEEYEGVAILATNFSQNLDEAFARRMSFVIDFPFPAAADRERIWRGLFPADAPRAADIDFAFLAQQFELAGGHIRNCVLTAAFLAVEEGAAIGMGHLVQGVARELAKMGRPLQKSAFASYFTAARQGRKG